MSSVQQSFPGGEAERGYVLAAVIITLAVMMIALATAIPKVREDIQRDKELETMHRGHQYVRAIQLYYRRFRRYPASIDNLEDTNSLRFLRQRYTDPLTGKNDWVPVLQGANKAPLSMGFFGEPLNMGAAVLTGSSSTSSNTIIGASPVPANPIQTSFGPTAFANDGQPSGEAGSASGTPFAGGPILGFSPARTDASIMTYKTKDRYNEWEFVYDPMGDPMVRGVSPITTPITPVNTGAPGFGPSGAAPAPPVHP